MHVIVVVAPLLGEAFLYQNRIIEKYSQTWISLFHETDIFAGLVPIVIWILPRHRSARLIGSKWPNINFIAALMTIMPRSIAATPFTKISLSP